MSGDGFSCLKLMRSFDESITVTPSGKRRCWPSVTGGSGLLTHKPKTDGTAIQLGAGATDGASVLGLDNDELATINTSGGLTVGSATTGTITVVGAALHFAVIARYALPLA